MEMILVCYGKGKAKTSGNDYWYVDLMTPCTSADNNYGRFGNRIDRQFIDEPLFNKLSLDMVGKAVDMKTSGFGRRVHIDDIFIVK